MNHKLRTIAFGCLFALAPLVQASNVDDFRPVYKLRNDLQCWPSHAANGNNSGVCLSREQFNQDAPPVYWETHEETVNNRHHELITYWNYYGNQNGCTTLDGGHDDDWEAITVHVVDNEMKHVTYWQHNGRYTKRVEDIELDDSHPIVYVGKYSHGNYHDQRSRARFDAGAYATGTYCYYWRDPRGPGQTWASGLAALDSVGISSVFPGSTNPLNRDQRPHERGVCRTDGGRVIAGIIDGTENTCDRNPDYLKNGNMSLRDMFDLNIY